MLLLIQQEFKKDTDLIKATDLYIVFSCDASKKSCCQINNGEINSWGNVKEVASLLACAASPGGALQCSALGSVQLTHLYKDTHYACIFTGYNTFRWIQ